MKPFLILFLLSTFMYAEDVLNPTPTKLNPEANVAITEYKNDVEKFQADADKLIAARAEKARIALQKAQDNATKKGDLDTALAIKDAIGKLPKAEGKKELPVSLVHADGSLTGNYDYSFTGGHKGKLKIAGDNAQDIGSGVKGKVTHNKREYTITWANGTQWNLCIGEKGECMAHSLSTEDGDAQLMPNKE